MLKLMYITNDERIAKIADKTGVDRVWVDLEKKGKDTRQFGMNTVKSNHCLEDIKRIKPLLKNSKMLVRINPIDGESKEEIDTAIENGAEIIMLPYFKTLPEVKTFLKIVNKRVKTVLLLETKEGVEILDDILKLDGIDEIHIGLNDLHLSYKLDFMFEPLSNGMVESIVKKIKSKGIPYGFGGIAKLGEGMLKAEKIVAEHYRLGSTGAILSRSFYDTVDSNDYVAIEKFFFDSIKEIREYEKELSKESQTFFEENRKQVVKIVNEIKERKRANAN